MCETEISNWELRVVFVLLSHDFKLNNSAKSGSFNKKNPTTSFCCSFPFLSPFFTLLQCCVVLVLVCTSFFLSANIWIWTFLTARVHIGPSSSSLSFSLSFSLSLSHSHSFCWLAQVSPCPRMPLHPQQPSAFGLQLPETVPELLSLCSHTHLHWYAEAGKEIGAGERQEIRNAV